MIDQEFWQGKKVFVTGHTGFKGAWLTLWLSQMGAHVTGYSDRIDETHILFKNLDELKSRINHIEADVLDLERLKNAVQDSEADIVIHLAAQSLVKESYNNPLDNYKTNVIGTCNIMEVLRGASSVDLALIVTSDKCYRNNETGAFFKEEDALGGYDPYSASKACSEIVVNSYRHSFFDDRDIGIATARAGNVIGGGDFSHNRLIPDIIRATIDENPLVIRYPQAVRPWQHVLDCLSGYLLLVQNLYENKSGFSEAWNFGPTKESCQPVQALITNFQKHWHNIDVEINRDNTPYESGLLNLDTTKARTRLNWQTSLNFDESVEWTASWYKDVFLDKENIENTSVAQLEKYIKNIN
jgi:CDP-glucose 4,6-dehydratase